MSWNSIDQLGDIEEQERRIRPGLVDPRWHPPYKSQEEKELSNYLSNLEFNTWLDEHLLNPCTDPNCIYVICLNKKWENKCKNQ